MAMGDGLLDSIRPQKTLDKFGESSLHTQSSLDPYGDSQENYD